MLRYERKFKNDMKRAMSRLTKPFINGGFVCRLFYFFATLKMSQLRKERTTMNAKRERELLQRFFVNTEELQTIELKMQQLGTTNKSAYFRKMALDGYILKTDYSQLKELTQAINKIGTNINQIARRGNETQAIYTEDINDVKELQEKIWQLLKSTLLKAH